MKKMIAFDPAMCSSIGICGPSVYEIFLRASTVIYRLKNKNILRERHKLTGVLIITIA